MKFSIIVPVYNSAEFLHQCIDSILSQSFKDFDLICVDDGSTDESLSILRKYSEDDKRVQVIENQRGGVSKARNTGLEMVHGDYVLFVDSDDWILPGTLQILSETVSRYIPDVLVFNIERYIESDGRYIKESAYCTMGYDNGFDFYVSASGKSNIFGAVWGKLYSASLLSGSNISFNENLSYNEDVLFFMDVCAHAGLVRTTPDICYVYRIRQSGSLMSTGTSRRCLDMAGFANILCSKYLENPEAPYCTLCRTAASFYRSSLRYAEPHMYADVKSLIDWNQFYRVSKVSLKTFVAYIGLRFIPSIARSVLRYRESLKRA